ncbi:hypothetical protein DBR37_01525 [Herminiimonas sp. KBW02]|uniref:hypothetical protein n=1 Tax=Herminiimonas sp. KBW02 TaxID=2153363 RepID=UPI000F5A4EE9|nr:hypothetical protein [Herminiimonas sp. KBW02]RQO38602.1 hypothetical protein DBR37_01525 [Herminiimonas sp. KBW02]
MPFKPPLTLEQIRDIQDRNRDNPDVLALLWEIRRLFSIVARADQLAESLSPQGGIIDMIIDALKEQIANEPSLENRRKLTADIDADRKGSGYKHPSEKE